MVIAWAAARRLRRWPTSSLRHVFHNQAPVPGAVRGPPPSKPSWPPASRALPGGERNVRSGTREPTLPNKALGMFHNETGRGASFIVR